MKKLLTALIAVLMMSAAFAAASAEEAAVSRHAITLVETCVCETPDENAPVLATLAAGETLEIRTIGVEWSLVFRDGMEGYVPTGHLALLDGDAATEDEKQVIRTISISSTIQGQTSVKSGTVVTLFAHLTGFENDKYTIQWHCSTDGGATVNPIAGANSEYYSIVVTQENAHWMFAVSVTVDDEASAE